MKTRELVEGAFISGIIILMLLNFQFFSGFLFLLPVPLVFFVYKYNIKSGLIVYMASVILAFALMPLYMVFILIMQGMIGIYYGNGLKYKQDSATLILMTMVLSIAFNFITVVLFSKFFGYDINGDVDFLLDTLEKNQEMKISFSMLAIDTKRLFKIIYFALLPVIGGIEGYLTHVFSRTLLVRLKYNIKKPGSIIDYKPPIYSGYIAIGLVFMFFAAINFKINNPFIQDILIYIGTLGFYYLMFFGIVFLIILGKLIFNKVSIIYSLIIFISIFILSLVIMMIGFIYITTDLRKKMLERINNAS